MSEVRFIRNTFDVDVTRLTSTPRWLAMIVRTSLAEETSCVAFICCIDVNVPMVMTRPPNWLEYLGILLVRRSGLSLRSLLPALDTSHRGRLLRLVPPPQRGGDRA